MHKIEGTNRRKQIEGTTSQDKTRREKPKESLERDTFDDTLQSGFPKQIIVAVVAVDAVVAVVPEPLVRVLRF